VAFCARRALRAAGKLPPAHVLFAATATVLFDGGHH
jgi:hypothetical protein